MHEQRWREGVLVGLARVLAVAAPALLVFRQVTSGLERGLLGVGLVGTVGAVWVGFVRGGNLWVRAALVGLPLVGYAAIAAHGSGLRPTVVLAPALVSLVATFLGGLWAGLGVVGATAALIAVAGATGGDGAGVVVWVRHGTVYATFAGLLVAFVASALGRLEDALDRVHEAESRLKGALDAGEVSTWSVDRRTGRVSSSSDGDTDTVDALVASVAGEDRVRFRAALDEALAGKGELHVEHRVTPRGGTRWVEARARLRDDVLLGTISDITTRRDAEERRATVQRTLLALAKSDAAARGDADGALREIAEAGARLLDVARCSVWRLDEGGGRLVNVDLYSAAGHQRVADIQSSSAPAYFEALLSQRALAADDARRDPRTRDFLVDYLIPNGIMSMLDSPIHAGGRVVGVVCHEHTGEAPRVFSPEDQDVSASLADLAARAFESAERAQAERALERAYAQLGQVAWRSEAAREDERRRLARELHDDLGQSLTAIKMGLQLSAREGEAATRIPETITVVDRAIASLRTLSRAMRPPLLDELGLEPALQAFCDEQARLSGIHFELAATRAETRLGPELEIAVFRLVQEAVTNALRHATPRRVEVTLQRLDRRVQLVVRDDGRGFDVDETLARVDAGGHMGLIGMRERVRALGGTFGVSSTPEEGTEVRVEVPT